MTFAAPVVLWGLLGPLLGAITLVLLAVLRRHRAWSRWPGITRVVAIGSRVHPVSVGRGTRRPWLLLLALSFALVALARPRWGVIEEPVYQKSREVMLALDLSRSMLVQDVPPSRLERSRLLVRSLLDGLRGERVGLIVFAGTAFVQVPMSTDYQILEEFLPELKPGYMPQGGSDYAGMLRAALGGFSPAADTDRYLIVLSDGEAQDESWRKQLPALKEKGVHVIALGVGTTAGGFIPDAATGAYVKDPRGAVVLSRLGPATLQALAFETSGTYRDASGWVELAAVLRETIERGRQGMFTEKRAARAIERFQWFLFPALLCALLGVWREIPVRPRPRAIRPATTAPGDTRTTMAGATTAVALVAMMLILVPEPMRAAVEDQTKSANVDRLRSTVTRLAASDSVAPAGWKAMAEQTLVLAQELRQAGQPLEPGLVFDALAAVDRGESLDPRAADWKKLREDLRRLLEPPPPEQKPEDQKKDEQQQQQDQKDQQDQQQKQQSSGQQGDPKDDKSESKPSDQQKQDSPQSQDQQQQQQNQQPSQKQDSALGDLEKPPEQPPPQPKPQAANEPPKTRKFGGKQDTEQKQSSTDPELAAALARLEQVQENDSPARLHQRIQEEAQEQERQGAAPANPHDW